MNIPPDIQAQKQADYERRQKQKTRCSMLIIFGMMGLCNLPTLSSGSTTGRVYWIIAALAALGTIVYGFLTYLPIWREEKRERDAWHRQYQAEADAAREFLFGSAPTRL